MFITIIIKKDNFIVNTIEEMVTKNNIRNDYYLLFISIIDACIHCGIVSIYVSSD